MLENQKVRRYLLVAVTIFVALLIVIATFFYFKSSEQPKPSKDSSESEASELISDAEVDEMYEDEKDMVVSMEGDDIKITKEFIRLREERNRFAVNQVVQYLKKENPNYDDIQVRFTEEYNTDSNGDLHILVVTFANTIQGLRKTEMRVVKFREKGDSREVLSFYEPDEGYSIYDK